MSSIFIENLMIDAVIGIYDHEKTTPQPLRFNIEMALATEAALASDRLQDTIDYAAVAKFIREEMKTHQFGLLERAAGYLGPKLCAHFNAQWIEISIAKPNVVPGAAFVGVKTRYVVQARANRF